MSQDIDSIEPAYNMQTHPCGCGSQQQARTKDGSTLSMACPSSRVSSLLQFGETSALLPYLVTLCSTLPFVFANDFLLAAERANGVGLWRTKDVGCLEGSKTRSARSASASVSGCRCWACLFNGSLRLLCPPLCGPRPAVAARS